MYSAFLIQVIKSCKLCISFVEPSAHASILTSNLSAIDHVGMQPFASIKNKQGASVKMHVCSEIRPK